MVAFPTNAPTLSLGVNTQKDYRVLTANFGDGYTIRTGDGLNTQIEKWNMMWEPILLAEKDILMDFFDAQAGYIAFDFTAPGDSVVKKWIVKGAEQTPINSTYYKVSAVFERVYDL